ncbi:hypothetical protein ACHAXR_007053 [Thalassiosira sp. AJA248-18]
MSPYHPHHPHHVPHSQGGGGGYYHPPHHHPDSPPTSYGGHYAPTAGRGSGPPPHPHGAATAHEVYEPYDYANANPSSSSPPIENEAHYHVPATVSHEHHEAHLHHSQQRHQGTSSPASLGGGPPPTSGSQSPSSSSRSYHQFRKGGRSIHSEPIILRKKFSWRNYPELEEYLIANRTDYLRHSALNYTAEQKHFNNRLTEGLLELAAKFNYVFDETCFNFVAVRDRIRCYYKSYVQSSKKRGVVVGFCGGGGSSKNMKQEHQHGMGEL